MHAEVWKERRESGILTLPTASSLLLTSSKKTMPPICDTGSWGAYYVCSSAEYNVERA